MGSSMIISVIFKNDIIQSKKCYTKHWQPGETLKNSRMYVISVMSKFNLALVRNRGLYSLSSKMSYQKISWSLEAVRFGFSLFQPLWNLTDTSAAALPRCLSKFRAIQPLQHPILRLWDFTRFCGKTTYHLVNSGPVFLGLMSQIQNP